MKQWNIKFCPEDGERDSPFEFMAKYCTPKEQAIINDKLLRLSRLEATQWEGALKIKPIRQKKNLFQLTVGDFRVYLGLDHACHIIVVSYICRKTGQKAHGWDLDSADANLKLYFKRQQEGS